MSFILVVSAVIVVFVIIKKSRKNRGTDEEICPQDELKPLSWLYETSETGAVSRTDSLPQRHTSEISSPRITFHKDLDGLLWFADSPLKNIDRQEFIKKYEYNGVKIKVIISGMEEPSMIFTEQPVEIPADIYSVDRPSYYPTYTGLTPEQKGAYIALLKNPYDGKMDIGFVFILYYGLERHLLCGNWQKAAEIILRLRDVHTNKSFQQYSAYAITLTAILKKDASLAVKLLQSVDKDFETDNFPAVLFFLLAVSFNFPVSAKDLIRYTDWIGFTNKNYIKRLPEIFEDELKKTMLRHTGDETIRLQDMVSLDELNALPLHETKVFANTSLSETKADIPYILENQKLEGQLYQLIAETHETVKKIAAEKRRNGELETPKKAKTEQKKKIPAEEYEARLSEAYRLIPLPAAYREAAVALRGLRRTDSENSECYVKQLYDLAVKNSLSTDYSDFCKCPGFNILETIPETVISSLEYTYSEMGYEKLSLLTVTDIKSVTGLWGEPKSHKTLNEKYHKLWHDYELKYRRENPF